MKIDDKEFDLIIHAIPRDLEIATKFILDDIEGYVVTGELKENSPEGLSVSVLLRGEEIELTDNQKFWLQSVIYYKVTFV